MRVAVEQPKPPASRRAVSGGQTRGFSELARDMMEVSPGLVAYNLGYLMLVWAVAIGGIVLFWLEPAWYTFALALLLVSSRQQALLNIEHEAIHGKLVPSRRINELIGRWLCAAPVGSPYSASQNRHLTHHRLLGTADDPDRDLHSGDEKRTRWGLVKHFLGGLLGGYAGMVLMGPKVRSAARDERGARRDLVSIAVAQTALAGSFTLIFAWWVYPALWLAPLLTVTVLFHLVRSFVEHAITETEEPSHSNRLITIHSNLIERGLVAPYNMNYHAEHHIVPSVPAPRLRALQRRLQNAGGRPPVLKRSSYGAALLRYARSLQR